MLLLGHLSSARHHRGMGPPSLIVVVLVSFILSHVPFLPSAPLIRSVSAAPINFTICFLPRRIEPTLHARHAVQYYAPSYGGGQIINWRFKYVSSIDPTLQTLSTRTMMLGWLNEGGDCDALIGPGSSSLAVAVSPLVNTAWIDYSATSTALSDKRVHPLFNRGIATDELSCSALLLMLNKLFGWKSYRVISVNEAYSQSLTAEVQRVSGVLGGKSAVTYFSNPVITEAEVDDALARADQPGQPRVIFLAMLASDPLSPFFTVVKRINETKAYRKFIFVFSESACSLATSVWQTIPGSFCAPTRLDATRLDPFMTSYRQRATVTADVDELVARGYTRSSVNPFATSVFAALAVHSVQHVMNCFYDKAVNPSTKGSWSAVQVLRQCRTVGVSGALELDGTTGDRKFAYLSLLNSNAEQRIVLIGAGDGNVTFRYGESLKLDDPGNSGDRFYILGQSYSSPADIFVPDTLPFVTQRSLLSADSAPSLIAIICAVICVLIWLVFVMLVLRSDHSFSEASDRHLWAHVFHCTLRIIDTCVSLAAYVSVTLASQSPASATSVASLRTNGRDQIFLIIYGCFLGVSFVAATADIINRFALTSDMLSTEHLRFSQSTMVKWDARRYAIDVINIVLSNAPRLVLASLSLTDFGLSPSEGIYPLLVGALVIASFTLGLTGLSLIGFVRVIARTAAHRRRNRRGGGGGEASDDNHHGGGGAASLQQRRRNIRKTNQSQQQQQQQQRNEAASNPMDHA